ncbi:MAG: methionyl-tRNA formyltransferase [Anaerolineae bacterium]|nr:MAG: methionyl-tRNA formyltransferase [Anaerolineae bacterium]
MNLPRTVFMGSPDFAVPALRALAAEKYPIVGVITQPDRPAGRGNILTPPPVKVAALELGLEVLQPEKLRAPEAMQQLRAWNPDLIVVAAFGQILRPDVLSLPRYGCVNIHASLLPRHRGAAPIQAAILAGDKETGITIMLMDEGIDTGPMLARRSVEILPTDTGGSLFEKLSVLGGELLLETLPRYLSGELLPQPQPAEGATYAPMLKKEDGRLDFSRPAGELERKVRAFHPWPGAFMDWQGAPLKIHKAHVERNLLQQGTLSVGQHLLVAGFPAVMTSEDILVLDEIQPPGKGRMSGKAFLAGGRTW